MGMSIVSHQKEGFVVAWDYRIKNELPVCPMVVE